MRYHNITKDDMLNGDGLRVVLWVSGCSHGCTGCHNSCTWNPDSGLVFEGGTKQEIFMELEKDYISGITLSGGDPLHIVNRMEVYWLLFEIKNKYPNKTIWLYTGYEEDDLHDGDLKTSIYNLCDVVVTGRFIQELADVNYHWAGSTNQRIIDVKESLKQNKVVLWNS